MLFLRVASVLLGVVCVLYGQALVLGAVYEWVEGDGSVPVGMMTGGCGILIAGVVYCVPVSLCKARVAAQVHFLVCFLAWLGGVTFVSLILKEELLYSRYPQKDVVSGILINVIGYVVWTLAPLLVSALHLREVARKRGTE